MLQSWRQSDEAAAVPAVFADEVVAGDEFGLLDPPVVAEVVADPFAEAHRSGVVAVGGGSSEDECACSATSGARGGEGR